MCLCVAMSLVYIFFFKYLHTTNTKHTISHIAEVCTPCLESYSVLFLPTKLFVMLLRVSDCLVSAETDNPSPYYNKEMLYIASVYLGYSNLYISGQRAPWA